MDPAPVAVNSALACGTAGRSRQLVLSGVAMLVAIATIAPLSFTGVAESIAYAGEANEAEDFLVQTSVHVRDDVNPVAENRTWFVGSAVYDELIGEPGEISVLDLDRQVIHLLDITRRVQATITGHELTQFAAAMKVEAQQANSPLARFAAAPKFELLDHADAHQFQLKSDWLEYRVTTEDCDPQIAERYRQFCDWYARLNATRVGALPPQARLELNSQLALKPRVPTQIKLTIRNEKTATELVSRHQLVRKLTESDRQRVRQIDIDRSTFRTVSLAEFRGWNLATRAR